MGKNYYCYYTGNWCNSNCFINPLPPDEEKKIATVVQSQQNVDLKIKAGKINEMVVYKRYDDAYPEMSVGLQQNLTKTIFNNAADSIRSQLGSFINPIDTTYSSAFGVDNIFVKNQYENGVNINTLSFDKEGKLVAVWCNVSK